MHNYERKVRKVKQAIKNLVVVRISRINHISRWTNKFVLQENSSLCDEIADVQERIDQIKQEREFLVRKLVDHEPASSSDYVQDLKKKRKYSSEASVTKKGKLHQINPNPKLHVIKQEIKQENDGSTYLISN